MNKTKVRLSQSLFEYQQWIAERVDDAREERLRLAETFDDSIEPFPTRPDIPEPDKPGLLKPPRIEMLWPDLYIREGKLDGIIQINTSDVFGVLYISITLLDETGTVLESGYAMRNEICEGHWGYIPDINLPVGTPVIVRAVARDTLGAMGMAQEKVTVCDHYTMS